MKCARCGKEFVPGEEGIRKRFCTVCIPIIMSSKKIRTRYGFFTGGKAIA